MSLDFTQIKYKVPIKDGTIPELNTVVRCEHGLGKIVAQEILEHLIKSATDYFTGEFVLDKIQSSMRYGVYVFSPYPKHKKIVESGFFPNQILCYWPRELVPERDGTYMKEVIDTVEVIGGIEVIPVSISKSFGDFQIYQRTEYRKWKLPKYVICHKNGSVLKDARTKPEAIKLATAYVMGQLTP